jgi:hypothetical protein
MLNRRSFLSAMGAAAAVLTMPVTIPKLPRWFGAKPLVVRGNEVLTLVGGSFDHVIVEPGGHFVGWDVNVKTLEVYGIAECSGTFGAIMLYDEAQFGIADSGTRTCIDLGATQTPLRVVGGGITRQSL